MALSLFQRRTPTTLMGDGDLLRLRDEVGRTFDRFFNEPFSWMGIEPKMLRSEGWLPPIDVSQTDNEVTIKAEIPGIPVKDLDISITGTMLTIAGEKEEQKELKEADYYHCERRFGSFKRSLDLPDTIDPEKVTAESDNGVVTIRIAKKPGAKPRQIEVRPSSKRVQLT